MPGRLVHKADFERLLGCRWRSRSAHFALHHVPERPSAPVWRHRPPETTHLSTGNGALVHETVDNPPSEQWLGCLVPKRHARRAVTRSLVKRQMRASFARHAARLPAGVWLLRLRAGFAAPACVSAASAALGRSIRDELDGLLRGA